MHGIGIRKNCLEHVSSNPGKFCFEALKKNWPRFPFQVMSEALERKTWPGHSILDFVLKLWRKINFFSKAVRQNLERKVWVWSYRIFFATRGHARTCFTCIVKYLTQDSKMITIAIFLHQCLKVKCIQQTHTEGATLAVYVAATSLLQGEKPQNLWRPRYRVLHWVLYETFVFNSDPPIPTWGWMDCKWLLGGNHTTQEGGSHYCM